MEHGSPCDVKWLKFFPSEHGPEIIEPSSVYNIGNAKNWKCKKWKCKKFMNHFKFRSLAENVQKIFEFVISCNYTLYWLQVGGGESGNPKGYLHGRNLSGRFDNSSVYYTLVVGTP